MSCMIYLLKRLILSGRTTLEFCEKKNENKYGRGAWENLTDVLGKNVLLWWIPAGKLSIVM